jgi:hypothetical protein
MFVAVSLKRQLNRELIAGRLATTLVSLAYHLPQLPLRGL